MKLKYIISVLLATCLCVNLKADNGEPGLKIKRLHIVPITHLDYGYVDLPSVSMDLFNRYIEIALDAIAQSKIGKEAMNYCWTVEGTHAVYEWWNQATKGRQKEFLRAVDNGYMEVTAVPFNQSPFLNADEWKVMGNWLPKELWDRFEPKVAMQNDVNGFPRAGALTMLNKGVRYLWMGINADSGGAPFERPSGFWWEMPDGRKMLVWLNVSYAQGYDYFEVVRWRKGDLPFASDTRYQVPATGDFLKTDSASLIKSNKHCISKLLKFQEDGYTHEDIAMTFVNNWRIDSDPPFLGLSKFVNAWNAMGLKPELVLTSSKKAMEVIEKSVGNSLPTYKGEFVDWWANGNASAPRELAASRMAKRDIASARSPLWGKMSEQVKNKIDIMLRDLCMFEEHTWGAAQSVTAPWSLNTQSQFNEKSSYAWRSMGQASWLLSQRARLYFSDKGEGVFITNPTDEPFTGWVSVPAATLRGNYNSLTNSNSQEKIPMFLEEIDDSDGTVKYRNASTLSANERRKGLFKFWVKGIPANSYVKLTWSEEKVESSVISKPPQIVTDHQGWPVLAAWEGIERPLFDGAMGELVSYSVNGPSPRSVMRSIDGNNSARSQELRRTRLEEHVSVSDGMAAKAETPYSVVYIQKMKHPGIEWGIRKLELYKGEPRARLSLKIHRLSMGEMPGIIYAGFGLPIKGILPELSNGGIPFTPFIDQIPGTCNEYFAIDNYAKYSNGKDAWLINSRDAALSTIGTPRIRERKQEVPVDPERYMVMLFNNMWYTNFVGDQSGIMEFQIDIIYRKGDFSPERVARSLETEPLVTVTGENGYDPIYVKRLFTP